MLLFLENVIAWLGIERLSEKIFPEQFSGRFHRTIFPAGLVASKIQIYCYSDAFFALISDSRHQKVREMNFLMHDFLILCDFQHQFWKLYKILMHVIFLTTSK